MPKFKKRPIVIEAEQFLPGVHIPKGLTVVQGWGCNTEAGIGGPMTIAYVETKEGRMSVKPRDWIITGIAGEKYACDDEIFQRTYEPVEE